MKHYRIIIILLLVVFATDVVGQKERKKKKSNKKALVEVNINTKGRDYQPQPIQVKDETAIAEAKGVGLKREDALQDALRNAVSQAIGVSISSETRVENYMIMQDAISSKSQGYISSYDVIHEVPFPDRYELTVRANVSLSPLKADINTLARSIGGIRFLVMYDDRNMSKEDILHYDYAVERINEHLSNRGYRYIEKKRFDELKKEARNIGHEIKPSQETYIQRLGMMSDAQFIIFISKVHISSRSEAFDTRIASKYVVEVKAYDNCTAEGLGTTTMESDWNSSRDETGRMFAGIQEAVKNDFIKLLEVFNRYIGSWVNNGTPFELRFYQVGTYRDFRTLRSKLQEDSNFGGEIEIVSIDNYTKINCTYKNRPDQLADKILDMADAIPDMKEKVLDVKLIYGRQINFAPQNLNLPELQIIKTE